jgi:cell division protein ZapA (FtsZ GTPase activity inhibitor)
MAEQNESVEVEIYGSTYKIRSTETTPPKYIQKIAAEVDKHMRKFAEGNPRLDYSRLAVLAAIHLADERHKQQREVVKDNMVNEFQEAKYNKAIADAEKHAQALADAEAKVALLQKELLELEERMAQTQQVTVQVEKEDFALEREYQQLKDDYAKLQNEFNEWIEFAEKND